MQSNGLSFSHHSSVAVGTAEAEFLLPGVHSISTMFNDLLVTGTKGVRIWMICKQILPDVVCQLNAGDLATILAHRSVHMSVTFHGGTATWASKWNCIPLT